MQSFDPPDPDFESRVRSSFALQHLMTTIGANITTVLPGEVHIELTFASAWTQQHGFIHAGIITSIVDSACGYAANTLMPAGSGVLTVEYKVNFLNPAKAEKFVAIGRVIKPGRTLTVCVGEVTGVERGEEQVIATMQATMMSILERK
jgi:uncharacterized protein (TIGR00369 family)